jgi:putative ABC transport system permease protein
MNFWFDLKYAWRLLNRSWGYSLLSATVVALSVGLALWTFVLAYSQAFKPLGFPGSEHWYNVQVAADAAAVARPTLDAFTFQEIRERTSTAEHLGAFANHSVVLSEGEASTSLRAAAISPRLLAATQASPHLGRRFEEADAQTNAAPSAILSYQTWQNYFAGDPAIVGKHARIDAQPVQIIGVMPKDFFAFQDFELWVPLRLTKLARPQDSSLTLSAFIAMDDGGSTEAVTNEMKRAVDEVNQAYPELFNARRHVELIAARHMWTHPNLQIVGIICLMSVAILLLGCVNISMMFLARFLERSRELALRTALGASRPRLLRQCLLETGFVVLLGLVAGCALAALGVGWARDLSTFTTQVQAIGREPNMLAFRSIDLLAAILAAIGVWLLSTLIPAWRVAKQDAALTLAGSGKGSGNRGSGKGASVLVGLQVLISSLVLVIAANLVLAVDREAGKPTGLDSARVLISTYQTDIQGRYPQSELRLDYFDNLKSRIQDRVPGAHAAFTTAVPTRPQKAAVALDTRDGAAREGELTMPFTVASEGYFELLGLELRSGRLFDSTDNAASLNVALVDEKLARRYWPNEEALGKRIQVDPSEGGPWLTVVGVVSGVAGQPFAPDNGVVYRPLRQVSPAAFHLLVKLPDSAQDHRVALREAAYSVDKDTVLHNLQTLDDYLDSVNMSYKSLVPVFLAVAAITGILAATGLFGLISRSVALRTHEVGIRRALGATQWRAISQFLKQGGWYLMVSVVGVALGVLLTNLMSAVFTNILERVLLVTPSVVLLTAAVIFAASYLPARRAVSLEPGDALRNE